MDLTKFPGKDHKTAYGDAQALSGKIVGGNGMDLSQALASLIGSDEYRNQMTDAPGKGGRQDAIEGIILEYRKAATDMMTDPASPHYRNDIADALKEGEKAYLHSHIQHTVQ